MRRSDRDLPAKVTVLSYEKKKEMLEKLPAPKPGLIVDVPLIIWPEYQEAHRIKPTGYRHPFVFVERE